MKVLLKNSLISYVIIVSVFVSGCTPQKAKAIQTAAIQFKIKAKVAINAIEELMLQELQSVPRDKSVVDEEFVRNILEYDHNSELEDAIIDQAIDPYTFTPDAGLTKSRADFKNTLVNQYTVFSSIFNDIDKGSYLSREAVKESAQYAKKLTAQFAAFAVTLKRNPPKFIQYRSHVLNEIDSVRLDENMNNEAKRKKLIQLKDEWEAIKFQERELQRITIQKCLSAALLGKEVHGLIIEYDNISLDELHTLLNIIVEKAGSISGKDLNKLKSQSDEVFSAIKSDPEWSSLADAALDEVIKIINK